MAIKLQIRRGLKQDLPVLAAGEFGLCEDTGELFIGTTGGNLPVLLPDGSGDMLKSVYDTDNDGVVDKAESVPWAGVTGKPAALPADGGNADTVDGKHASEFASAAQGAKADGAVPSTRTINGKALSANISLIAADVSALGKSEKATAALTADQVLGRPWEWAYTYGTPEGLWGKVGSDTTLYYPSELEVKKATYATGGERTASEAYFDMSTSYLYGIGNSFGIARKSNAKLAIEFGYDGSYWAWQPVLSGVSNFNIGNPNFKWRNGYFSGGIVQTSDRNSKNTIVELGDTALALLQALKPSSYKMNDGTSGRTHYGFISQDIWEAMQGLGMTDKDFGGYCRDSKKYEIQVVRESVITDSEDGDMLGLEEVLEEEYLPALDANGNPECTYSLRYDEIVPLAVLGAQEALRRADILATENKALRDALAALTARVAALETQKEEQL